MVKCDRETAKICAEMKLLKQKLNALLSKKCLNTADSKLVAKYILSHIEVKKEEVTLREIFEVKKTLRAKLTSLKDEYTSMLQKIDEMYQLIAQTHVEIDELSSQHLEFFGNEPQILYKQLKSRMADIAELIRRFSSICQS